MINRHGFIFFLVSTVFLLPSCQLLGEGPDHGTIFMTGTAVSMPIQGGVWLIRSDNGTTYEPLNLLASFQEDGLRVRIRGVIRTDLASLVQAGPILDIRTVERL